MANSLNLSDLSFVELRALSAQVEAEIRRKEKAELSAIQRDIHSLAKSRGFIIKSLEVISAEAVKNATSPKKRLNHDTRDD